MQQKAASPSRHPSLATANGFVRLWPQCKTWFLGPTWVSPQMASRSFQLFLHSSLTHMPQTTLRAACVQVMRPDQLMIFLGEACKKWQTGRACHVRPWSGRLTSESRVPSSRTSVSRGASSVLSAQPAYKHTRVVTATSDTPAGTWGRIRDRKCGIGVLIIRGGASSVLPAQPPYKHTRVVTVRSDRTLLLELRIGNWGRSRDRRGGTGVLIIREEMKMKRIDGKAWIRGKSTPRF